MTGSSQQTQLARVIGFGALARQVEQAQVQPGTALTVLLHISTDAADQVGTEQKQALVGQLTAGFAEQHTYTDEQQAEAPAAQTDRAER